MKPFCHITSNGNDISDKISDYLLSIEITDEADDKSDSVTLTLDDRPRASDGAWLDIPLVGTILSVIMGYEQGVSRFMGSYLIDEITVSPAPRTLSISGKAAAMHKSYRTPQSHSYHQKTLGSIIEEIAERNAYEAKLDPDLASIVIRHADQHNESDMAFATRIAGDHDGVAKPVDNKLVLAKRGTGKAVTGEELPVLTLNQSQCSNWQFQYSARDEAGEAQGIKNNEEESEEGEEQQSKGGVRAFYHDIRTGDKRAVTVGQEPYHDLRYSWHNEAEAKAAISTYQNRSNRGKATLSCDMGGNPLVVAESRLILAPPFRAFIPALWRIKSVKHKLDANSGYVTSIDCELFDEKQQDAVDNVRNTTPATDDMIDQDAPPRALQAKDEGEGVIHMPD